MVKVNMLMVFILLMDKEMNGEKIIPLYTPPLGSKWTQPHRRFVEIDETHALMSVQTFKGLKEYSTTLPEERKEGMMWKVFMSGSWHLCWFTPDNRFENALFIEKREILMFLDENK